ncbi:hypothetical protein AVEN_193276-1 [Araneus ventricosus]|uniref:Histone-lysine N-methyltransferase SETMAR n=1 Tax=Araneus ventricosus TaxID=182803 RepID=A0A4Y2L9R2_ARAVE|nr:hypothetical protein AVEN_193276-1 [Araneus ventricosus]
MPTHAPILLVSLKTLFSNSLGFDHLSYSPDLAPSDCPFFLNLKRDFRGRIFDSDDDAENGVLQWLSSLAASFFEEGIDKLVSRYEECLNNGSNYVEK